MDAFFPTEEDRLDFPQFAKCFAVFRYFQIIFEILLLLYFFRPVRHHDKNNQQAPNSFRNKVSTIFKIGFHKKVNPFFF